MANAQYDLILNLRDNAGKTLKELKKELANLSKEFHKAEIGSEEFVRAGQDILKVEKNVKKVSNAFRDQERQIHSATRAVAQYRAGLARMGRLDRKIASPIGGATDIFGSPAQLQAMRQAQAETERIAREYRRVETAARRAKEEAVELFRIGMKARQTGDFTGTGSVIASPLRGRANQAGSPANRDFVANRRSAPRIEVGSFRAVEIKLETLRDKASRVKPDTEAWKKLQRQLKQTEDTMARMEKKRIPRGQRAMGMAKGGAKALGRGLSGAGAAALAGGGIGTTIGSGIGMMVGGPLGGLAGAGIGQAVDQMGAMAAKAVESYNAVERMKRGLAMASVDAADFAESNALVRESSQKLLMPLEKTYKHFSQLRVNTKQFGMSAKETQKILEGTALAVSSTGGSMEDVDGAMRAVVQIFSKGTVQAEELRGQLGERFPGAVVKFAAANKMSMQELQDGLKKGQIGIAEFVNFAKQNYDDYSEFAEQLATAPEYAARRAEIAIEQMSIQIGKSFAPLGLEFQQLFADAMTAINNFMVENKDAIDTFVRDLQIVIRRLSDFAGFVAKIAGEIAGFLAPAIDMMRELLGLKGAGEFTAKAQALDVQIGALEEKRSKATDTRTRNNLGQRLNALRSQRNKALTDAENAAADETQQAVNRTTDSATGDKTYSFGGAPDNPLDPNFKSGGNATGGGKQRVDMTQKMATLQEKIRKIKMGIAKEDGTGNELLLVRAEAEADIFGINEKQMLPREKAAAIAEIKNQLTIDEIEFIKRQGEELAKNILLEQERKDAIAQALFDQKVAAGEVSEVEAAIAEFTRQQLEDKKEFMKLKPTPEQVAAFESGQAAAAGNFAAPGTLKAKMKDLESEMETMTKFDTMAIKTADTFEQEFGSAISSVIQGTSSMKDALGNMFANMSKMFADMVAQMIAKWATLQLIKGLGSMFGGGAPAVAGAANGAVWSGGFQPFSANAIKPFANGGIVKGPTLGLVGEGKYNEAVVPLPDGKKIPVEMGKNAGGNVSSSVVVNINNSGGSDSSTSGSQGNQLAKGIEGAVKDVIMREMRPGGMIASRK